MKFSTRLRKVFTPHVVVVVLLIIVAIITAGYLWGPQLVELFSEPDRIKRIIDSAGPFGPIVFVLLQAAQVILAPIPGNVTGVVGGAIFDWWGLPLTMLGSAIGIAIVTAISRRFGRPLIERLFKKKDIERFDFLIGNKAELALFLIFLLPFFPDDLIGYLAGLTSIRFRNIILIAMIGRLPMQIVYNFFGGSIFEGDIMVLVIILAVMALLAVALYLGRKWLYGLVKAENHLEYIKNSFKRNDKKSKNDDPTSGK